MSPGILRVVENTAVSHVNCRVTRVYESRLTPWLLHSSGFQDSELSLLWKEGVTLGKVILEF